MNYTSKMHYCKLEVETLMLEGEGINYMSFNSLIRLGVLVLLHTKNSLEIPLVDIMTRLLQMTKLKFHTNAQGRHYHKTK
jgi:hypothetical protein